MIVYFKRSHDKDSTKDHLGHQKSLYQSTLSQFGQQSTGRELLLR
jgi:hypothetical protein